VDAFITGEICGLVSHLPLRLFMVSSIVSSLDRLSILCLFSTGCSAGPLTGVGSSLSLFLPLSSFRGVYNTRISGALVWRGGIFPWPCSFDVAG